MRGHTGWVNSVVHLPGGQHIITCSLDSSLRLWNIKSGKQICEDWLHGNEEVWSMTLSSNGKIIASGSKNGVRLWDVETKKVIATWTGHSNVVCALCWSGDGERVASGSWDGTARIWDVNSSKNILTIETGHNWVRAVIYSPDSSKLVTGGYEDFDNAVKIWDAKSGELLKTLDHDFIVLSLAWTSRGQKLISGLYILIRIFDTATWQQIAILEGHTNFVTDITLSQNNRLLASVSYDKTARLWSLDTNLPIGQPLQHEDALRSAALSPDGKVLVTGCKNGNANTWDIHAILKKAGLEDLFPINVTNIASKDWPEQKAFRDDSHTPRSSLDDMSFLEADATRCPDQFGNVDELSPAFFAGMEVDVDSSPMGGVHSFVNALLARLSSFLQRFRSANGEAIELQQPPERPSVFHLHALLVRLSSLLHRSPPEIDLPDELQQPSTPSRLHPRVLLAHLFPKSLLTGEEAEPHSTIPSSLHPAALISRLSSLRSQPYTNEEIELTQRLSRPPVVEVAAVRDKRPLVVAQGPRFKKAKREYEQKTQSHSQSQALSSHVQPVNGSTSTSPPAPGTAAPQPPPISWWAQIVLFICCVHTNGH
ncbi:WD40 repeat-like protein [Suillus decipiens]|nr:WD40 repeat-like protein [Suillus decipiens]